MSTIQLIEGTATSKAIRSPPTSQKPMKAAIEGGHGWRYRRRPGGHCNPGCIGQLELGMRRAGRRTPVRHLSQLLVESYQAGDDAGVVAAPGTPYTGVPHDSA
jgi:hypothetical protein